MTMVGTRLLGVLLIVAFAALAGCEPVPKGHVRGAYTGADLGKPTWHEISDRESVMWLDGSPAIRRIEADTSLYDGRYQEKIYLRPGYVRYEKATSVAGFRMDTGIDEVFLEKLQKIRQ